MNYLDLKLLPREHPLRTNPLAEIKAEVRNRKSSEWRLITHRWTVGTSCYNDLGGAWLDYDELRAPWYDLGKLLRGEPQ